MKSKAFSYGLLYLMCTALSLTLSSCVNLNAEEDFPTGPCDIEEVSFSVDIVPIIERNCYRCHDQANQLGGVILIGYNRVQAYALNGSLQNSIRALNGYEIMPNDNAVMPECEIRYIEEWIDAGALNN